MKIKDMEDAAIIEVIHAVPADLRKHVPMIIGKYKASFERLFTNLTEEQIVEMMKGEKDGIPNEEQ